MCRHTRKNVVSKRQPCIQCAFQRGTHSRHPERGDTTSSSFDQEERWISYIRVSAHVYHMEISAFMQCFSITTLQLQSTKGIVVDSTSSSFAPEEVWVTVDVRNVTDNPFVLLNPGRQAFFYKLVRGEHWYGFGHEPSLQHAIRKYLYVFKFVEIQPRFGSTKIINTTIK